MDGVWSYMYVYACVCVCVGRVESWLVAIWYVSTTLKSPYKINVFIRLLAGLF